MVSTLLSSSQSRFSPRPMFQASEPLRDRDHHFRRGELLSLQSNLVWQIQQGFVRTLTWDDSGTVMTLGIWGRGDFVGQSLSQIHPYQIECLTEVYARKSQSIEATSPAAMLNHVHQTEKLLSIVHHRQTSTKILLLLEWLAQRFGHETGKGWALEMRLTHQVISEVIGTTRVTVTRILRELEQEGRLIRDRKTLILPK